jgi:hypothetical protein
VKSLGFLRDIIPRKRDVRLPSDGDASVSPRAMNGLDEPLSLKLYRYFFIGWMLRRPHGDLFTRQAQRRANLALLQRWLPHYARAHGVLTVFWGVVVWALGKTIGGLWLALAGVIFGAETMFTLTLACAALAFVLSPRIGDVDDDAP